MDNSEKKLLDGLNSTIDLFKDLSEHEFSTLKIIYSFTISLEENLITTENFVNTVKPLLEDAIANEGSLTTERLNKIKEILEKIK